MKIIKTIDLWTEPNENQYECFNGAFIDGFENGTPYDRYKIIKNCNCIIDTNNQYEIRNKHHAIIFYKNNNPVRLVVINKNTNLEKCIQNALNQIYKETTLKEIIKQKNIKSETIDLKQKPIKKNMKITKELDVGSCDRWNLLYTMLKGSYTEDKSNYGNFESNKYEFIPTLNIKYTLETNEERFEIEHKCGFLNNIETRLILIQENSNLTING